MPGIIRLLGIGFMRESGQKIVAPFIERDLHGRARKVELLTGIESASSGPGVLSAPDRDLPVSPRGPSPLHEQEIGSVSFGARREQSNAQSPTRCAVDPAGLTAALQLSKNVRVTQCDHRHRSLNGSR